MTTTQQPGSVVDLRDDAPRSSVATTEHPPDIDVLDRTATQTAARAHRRQARKPVRSGTDIATVVSRGLTTFSLLVAAMIAFLFVFSGFAEARTQVGLQRRFAQSVQFGAAPTGGAIDNGVPVAELRIPAIGLRQIVVEGTTSGVLRAGPGHLRQTPLPGQAGNAVLFARRAAYGGPFRHLSSLTRGDEIQVWTGQGHVRYVVDSVHTAKASDGDPIATTTGKNQLTLGTSDPAYFATSRLYAVAHLVETPFAASADPTPVTRAELGLSGETDGILALVLWLEVLLMASVGATWLWRRWTRWSAYLVCVPVVLAVGWIVFENVTKLLPAML